MRELKRYLDWLAASKVKDHDPEDQMSAYFRTFPGRQIKLASEMAQEQIKVERQLKQIKKEDKKW